MTTQPRTAAGRALLRNIRDYGSVVGTADQILAIEAEAAAPALDVERLAEALMAADGVQGFGGPHAARAWAESIAAEYARLSADEEGQTLPAPGDGRSKEIERRIHENFKRLADEEGDGMTDREAAEYGVLDHQPVEP